MALANLRTQETASPWAYVAFEAEAAPSVWEPFESEPSAQRSFVPLEKAAAADRHEPGARDEVAAVATNAVELVARPAQDALRDETIAAYEHKLHELEQSHQAALVELEQRYAVDLLQQVTSRLELLGSNLALETGNQLTRLLAPMLVGHARKASMAALTRDLQRMLSSAEICQVKLSGPQTLLDQVKDGLGESAARFQIIETDAVDVTVEINSEVLATKLSGWAALLKEVAA